MTEKNTEIRKMDASLKLELVNLLDCNDGWKLLMSSVTVDCDPSKSKKYTVDHINSIEMASKTLRKSCSEIFLEEWGTSGKIRPSLKILMELLYDVRLIRAADCIARVINDICDSENFKSTRLAHQLDSNSTFKNDERSDGIIFPFKSLFNATNGFSDSCLIGAGGFGKVFKGTLNNQTVAIKLMEKSVEEKDKQYFNEINIVLKLKHDNLLPILAISYDEQPCVVYEFMEYGSLLDCIACENRSSLLTWQIRIKLGTDVARGLVYLHTAFKTPFIHRDIKTANILLDAKMIAKVMCL